jgi:hypothetical protein
VRHAGRHRPAIVAGGTYKPISVAPEEAQFLETTKANVATIARFYGVPPEMLAAESGNSLTYANVEQRSLDFLTDGVRPWLVRLERAISTLLPRNQHAKFNPDAIVRVALKDRYDAHATAIAAGFLTINEARELEDLPPPPARWCRRMTIEVRALSFDLQVRDGGDGRTLVGPLLPYGVEATIGPYVVETFERNAFAGTDPARVPLTATPLVS